MIAELRSALREAKAENSSLKTTHSQRENELQARVKKTFAHLREQVAALTGLQDRYENQARNLDAVGRERDALTAAATVSERKREANVAEIASLKEVNAKLESDLKQARDMLSGSTAPGVADLERASAEARRLQMENAGFEKKIASMKREFDFTRSAYQTASTSAAESATEINNLQNEIAILRSRASTNAIELAERNKRNENDTLARHISRLEATLTDREELLRRKEEELKELKRGRGMGTRGSSVLPGSPRGSRGASPVGGEAMLRVGSKGLGSNLRFGARAAPVRGEESS
ncbi:MAG: hypothetical protein Q9191_003040 [Dirinaria sp. TL-2023a]